MQRSTRSTIGGKLFARTLPSVLLSALIVGSVALLTSGAVTTNATLEGKGQILAISASVVLSAVIGAILTHRAASSVAAPITRMRKAAAWSTEVDLPEAMTAIRNGAEPDLKKFEVRTGDEIEALAESFDGVQQMAVQLAADQAHARRRSMDMFVNLARREQNLLLRQVDAISAMERDETDPEALRRLFHLDHLTTRLRRNAESLLVLAGEEGPRRFRKPVTLHQVVQAASAEIEHFDRVQLTDIAAAAIDGATASDIAHLLAELLENATAFTRPEHAIEVHGHHTDDGYTITIVDQGIGMDDDAIAQANAKIADPTAFERAGTTAYLGHHVVGHLAARHGLRVQLARSASGTGLTALVVLPASILQPTGETTTTVVDAGMEPAPTEPIPDVMPFDVFALDSPGDLAINEADRLQLEAIDLRLGSSTPAPASVKEQVAEPEPEPTPEEELTPSGFRKRRAGAEGAPKLSTAADSGPGPRRRTPDEVQASLERFRQGVEAGRSEVGGKAQ